MGSGRQQWPHQASCSARRHDLQQGRYQRQLELQQRQLHRAWQQLQYRRELQQQQLEHQGLSRRLSRREKELQRWLQKELQRWQEPVAPMKIWVRNMAGETICLHVNPSEPVWQLKGRLTDGNLPAQLHWLATDKLAHSSVVAALTLTLGTEVLKDSLSIAGAGVHDGAILGMVRGQIDLTRLWSWVELVNARQFNNLQTKLSASEAICEDDIDALHDFGSMDLGGIVDEVELLPVVRVWARTWTVAGTGRRWRSFYSGGTWTEHGCQYMGEAYVNAREQYMSLGVVPEKFSIHEAYTLDLFNNRGAHTVEEID